MTNFVSGKHRGSPSSLLTSSVLAVLGALSISPAQALVIEQNVNFAAVNRNPWTGGPAFSEEWHLNQPAHSFKVDLPKLNGNPLNIIADFLGVDLPIDTNVGIGGSIAGRVGFDFGYYVTGGRLNVNYPGLSTLNVQTPVANTNRVIAGQSFAVGTQFTPGLNTGVLIPASVYSQAAGAGYEALYQNLIIGTRTTDPFLKTTFPYASAWANFGYDLKAGAFVEATAKILGECIVCARKDMQFGDARDITLVEIDPGGSGKPPVVRFLGQDVNPLQPIQVGPAKITFSYPDVAVQGALQPDKSLFGTGAKPIIAVQGAIEKLVPFIGPFLSNGVGPLGYQLLSTDGGPTLGLYQDFRFTPDPRVRLDFSQPVLHRGANGLYTPTNTVDFGLGDTLDLIAPMTTNSNQLRVQPTYFLNNTVRNDTGLTLGVQFDIEALKLTTPLGPLGPAVDTTLGYEIARLSLFNEAFSIELGKIEGRPFDLDVHFPLFENQRYGLTGVEFQGGEGFYNISVLDRQTGSTLTVHAGGTELSFGEGPLAQKLLLTGDDVKFDGLNLGNTFCIVCVDASAILFAPESPSLTQDGTSLFLSDLSVFPSGEIDITGHPILGTNNFFDDHRPVPTVIGPTVLVVPEPGTLALFAVGLAGLGASRRRRII